MKKPTLQEWKRNNPGKSLNEYFKEYPATSDNWSGNFIANSYPKTQSVQTNQSIEKEPIDIGSILVSLMIIVAFFLPWIDIKLLGMFSFGKISGFKLPNILEGAYLGSPPSDVKSIYLIPICAFFAIVAETRKSRLKPVVQVIAILIAIYWFYQIKQLITYLGYQLGVQLDPLKFFSFGIHLTFLGCIFYAYDVIREFFK